MFCDGHPILFLSLLYITLSLFSISISHSNDKSGVTWWKPPVRGDTVRLNISKDKETENKDKDKVQSDLQRKDYYASGNNANESRFLIMMLVKTHLTKKKDNEIQTNKR